MTYENTTQESVDGFQAFWDGKRLAENPFSIAVNRVKQHNWAVGWCRARQEHDEIRERSRAILMGV